MNLGTTAAESPNIPRSYGVHRAMGRMKRSISSKYVVHTGKPKPAARRNIQL
ncbi:hypothetical protein [Paenibacillus sp. FSL M7-0896]|uniref:hypothetical protein n=1 Tax=Paenibacillus sp. FSL M7-0896 TaxID=2921610 RepID=UPI0030DBF80B